MPKLRRWLGAGAYPFLSRWIDPSRRYSQEIYSQLLSGLFPNGATWLDAGCGHQVFKLASVAPEAEIISRARLVIGSDQDFESLRIHRSVEATVCADLRLLPFRSKSFDVITLNYVVEHLEQPEKTFAELTRLLRPKGMIAIVTPNSLGYFVRLTRLGRKILPEAIIRRFIRIREFRSSEDIFPTFYRANTREVLKKYMKQLGLEEINLQMVRDPAIFSFIAPLAILELIFGRILSLLRLENLAAGTIIGIYRESGETTHKCQSDGGETAEAEMAFNLRGASQ
jgi:ubiquinone/menaquinone biosynthesis C-methylase UbiE